MDWLFREVGSNLLRTLTLILAICSSGSAVACEFEPWLFQLPGETEQATRDRSDQIMRDGGAVRHFAREEFDLKNAKTIYVARVIASSRGQGIDAQPMSTIEVVDVISGKPTSTRRTLVETRERGCSNWGDGDGDGQGVGAPVGELVIVFEGLPRSTELPNGTDSVRATSVRHVELLERLSKYGKELDY